MMKEGRSYTNKMPRVIDVLNVGKKNGIKQADLCEILKCTPDELKADVQRFRRKNTDRSLFICSDTNGYYIAQDDSEIREFVSLLTKQATTRLETVREAKRMLEETRGQVKFDGMGV